MRTSYAVVWHENGDSPRAGKLEIDDTGLQLEAAGHRQTLAFAELAAMHVGRAAGDRVDGRRTLVVERRDGTVVQIATLGEVGSLLELAELIGSHQKGDGPSAERLAVVVPIRRGSRRSVAALLEQGPPFDPEGSPLDRHDVFLGEREVVFLFEAAAGARVMERLVSDPRLWKAAAAWRRHLAGPPRVAEDVYTWARHEHVLTKA
jgi:hypothetical protein